ncbi:transposase [Methylobacterium nonmethylotrophicum]|uniref:IS5/IS1182 family transposase n=1 Tax=Methylobacterium nonmethylotrophicum TaxID=1141884 RepID=A0A4Z0NU65_9HYPH|nr:transposase [Methylobacterium nonmethylotrophicum]TGE00745.1 IS5/IS1182 family transposase [Methylobacterium nonmethylotrophicum]
MADDSWRIADALWMRMEPLLPSRPRHPLGCHDPRVPDRAAMDAIVVLRTGCQWNALNATGICTSSSAHRRFQERTKAGVFEAFWREGRLAHDALVGIDWEGLSTDGRGVPVGLVIAGANVDDHLLPRETLEAIPVSRPDPSAWDPQHLCLEKGDDDTGPRETAGEYGVELHLRRRGEEIVETRECGKRARRWVVERCHSWVNRFRALPIRWSKTRQNALALLHCAAAIVAWRHARVG